MLHWLCSYWKLRVSKQLYDCWEQSSSQLQLSRVIITGMGVFCFQPEGQLCSGPCSSPAITTRDRAFWETASRSGTSFALPTTPSLISELATTASDIGVCTRRAEAQGTLSCVRVLFLEKFPDWQHKRVGMYQKFGPTAYETGKEQLWSLPVEKDPEKALSHCQG